MAWLTRWDHPMYEKLCDPIPAGADPVWQPEWFHGDPVVWPPMVIMPMEGIIAMNADLPS